MGVIGTSRCAHVRCYLSCCLVDRVHRVNRCARSPRMYPGNQRCAARARKLVAESLVVGTAMRDAAMHLAPTDSWPGQRARHSCRSRLMQPPLEAVRRPTLAFGSRYTSAPVHWGYPGFDASRPKARAGSRLSLASARTRREPPGTLRRPWTPRLTHRGASHGRFPTPTARPKPPAHRRECRSATR